MYSNIKNVQILIALLKEYGINKVVCSPGNRNVSIVHSLENDSYFTTYSIVDERSAGFFGIGLIHHYKEPVAICCTSGTAVCNYYSAIAEAYYQKLPLLVITADRNPYFLNMDEEQMIPQADGYEKVTKKVIKLPIIKDEIDEYVCGRKINEGLLELQHNGCGPVQINIPIEGSNTNYPVKELPKVQVVKRYNIHESWDDVCKYLKDKKILILYGQSFPINNKKIIEEFAKKTGAVIGVDPLANLSCENSISTFLLSRVVTGDVFSKILSPDIVITFNSGYMSYVRSHLRNCKNCEHWTVNEAGNLIDPFLMVTKIFECSIFYFMNKINSNINDFAQNNYYKEWNKYIDKIENCNVDIPWSNLLSVKQLLNNIPQNSKFHIGNSSSIRMAAHFNIDPSIEVFCNRGTNGIDGSASAFMGMAYNQEELCYLLIGDLSFFYDMNSLWNKYVGKNLRIVLNNNSGATLFHYIIGKDNIPSINKNIAAEHNLLAKSYVESVGFIYKKVENETQMNEALEFMKNKELDKPVFVEVITDKEKDANILKEYYSKIKNNISLPSEKNILKKIIKSF